ncbi:hypothetical protein E2C01_016037 [Portunus trituberculatus]|uniref:Uncharacterized protein n=1 Tax=Portunus trituberculatus TaxID=210409 RepID=A0A5B7DPW9_PORTR|nr:hypothetical protein [Portunus trituberculatus]
MASCSFPYHIVIDPSLCHLFSVSCPARVTASALPCRALPCLAWRGLQTRRRVFYEATDEEATGGETRGEKRCREE